jgi:hypothetical protein
MNAFPEKVSDARAFAAAALLILFRLAMAIAFTYLLTFFIFETLLQPTRLIAGVLISLVGLFTAGMLLGQYRFLPAVVLQTLRISAVLFLVIACRFWTAHIPPRSDFAEVAGVILCGLAVGSAIIEKHRHSRGR